MEQDQQEMPSTSSVGSEGVVDEGAAAGGPTTTTTIGGEAAAAGNEVKVYATEEQIRAVFTNGLIADNIMSYMNFADLKAARQVSRTFFEMIETYKRFKEAQVLLITKENTSPLRSRDFIQDSDRIWRGIKIDVTLPSVATMDIPRHILKNVEFLSLVSEDIGGDDPAPVSTIRDILKNTKKISHLQMDLRLITRNLKEVFRYCSVRNNLRNLKHFEIVGFENLYGVTDRIYTLNHNDVSYDDYHSLAKNFLQLAEGGVLKRLESLRLLKMSFVGHGGRKRRFTRALMELLRRNLGTLRDLSLHLHVWETDDIRTMIFPRLKSLTVTARMKGQDRLVRFLVNHPSLEELDVAVEKKFGKGLFDAMKQRSVNLTKLHLTATKFVDVGGKNEETVDWTFLGEMERLKDFEIWRPTRNGTSCNWQTYGNGTRFLEVLPKNQLERLSFRAIGAETCGFWRLNDMEPELSYKLELLSGFRNLKCLIFRRCPDAVDDDVMRFIVKEMRSLEELEISDCTRVTDTGIAGTLEDGSDSIRNLKGLKELNIRYCPLVSPEGLLSCLKLPFLRRFDCYLTERRVPKSIVLGIISQNPSLESVSINMEYPEDVNQRWNGMKHELAEVKREINNSRLTKFENLVGWPSWINRDYVAF